MARHSGPSRLTAHDASPFTLPPSSQPSDEAAERAPALSSEDAARLSQWVEAVRGALVGQELAKGALILAVISRQHAYLEGPPGCGKSLLAEQLARLSGARCHTLAFHRDVRETDMLGDLILRRQREGRRERLRVDVAPGPLLDAEVALLEDLPRAPGEALGPLLRILADREALGRPLPLESAIGTGPAEIEGEELGQGFDPLEPGQLDRFGLQVRMTGLVHARRWQDAHAALRRELLVAGAAPEPVLDTATRSRLQDAAASLPAPAGVRGAYSDILRRFARMVQHHPDSARSLLSDRTFGRSAWSIFRAHALVRGGSEVEPQDLRALRYMVGKRLPEDLQEALEEIVEELLLNPFPDAPGGVAMVASNAPGMETEDGARTEAADGQGAVEMTEGEAQELPAADPATVAAAQVESLLRAFVGRIERGRVEPDEDPGGQPRGYRPLRRLDELFDGDLVEAKLFTEGRLPGAPRTYRRSRRNAGGAVVILRDVSTSMAGPRNRWAREVVAGLIRIASRRKMRVGYIEFHHRALPRPVAGRLLHRSYGKLISLAAKAHPLGQTNYQEPLHMALDTLQGRRGKNRHVVMLTDGLPITGDVRVKAERRLAERLGVSVHTVFLGEGECPSILDVISKETGGLRFLARVARAGTLTVEERT
ncbi:MAG: AAA family ATPase [Acidobacteriota bacterium]